MQHTGSQDWNGELYELIQMNWKAKCLLIHGTLNKMDDNILTVKNRKDKGTEIYSIREDIGVFK